MGGTYLGEEWGVGFQSLPVANEHHLTIAIMGLFQCGVECELE